MPPSPLNYGGCADQKAVARPMPFLYVWVSFPNPVWFQEPLITSIGIDLIEVARIEAAVRRWGDRFLHRVYTRNEIAYCFRRGENYRSLAARFAAKEAAMKALGTGWKRGVRWVDLEVTREPGSAPQMALHGRSGDLGGSRRFLVSLTHTNEHAVAVVIAESADAADTDASAH